MCIYVTYIMFAMLVYLFLSLIFILSHFSSSSTQLVFSKVVLLSRVLMQVSSCYKGVFPVTVFPWRSWLSRGFRLGVSASCKTPTQVR